MKTKLILASGTEVTVMHSIEEMDTMVTVNGFLVLNKENNGEIQVKPEAVVYREEVTLLQ